jgi:tRNA (cmo5U34)-methyltransferase
MDNLTPYKACEYDQKVRQTIPFYESIHAEAVRLVRTVKPEVKVWIDTGCGTGRLVHEALQSFPSARFVLADPSEGMLAQARARLSGWIGTCVTLLPPLGSADLTSQLAPESADVLTAIQCHHYTDQSARMRAVKACFQLLRPGGLFVAFENIAPRTAEGIRHGLAGWKSYLMEQGRTELEAERHVGRYGREFFPITVEQHLDVLAQAGFRVVELLWYSHMQAGFYGLK